MGDDRFEPTIGQAEEPLSDSRHRTEIAEFNQQVRGTTNGVAPGVKNCILDVVERKMKVASETEFYSATDILQLTKHSFVARAIVKESLVGMRRGHDVANSVFGRHPAHFGRNFP